MNPFVMNLLLAIVWMVVTGVFHLGNLIFGFLIGAGTLLLIRDEVGTGPYLRRGSRIISLAAFLIWDMLLSAWRVARTVLSPRLQIQPGVFTYRHSVETEMEIALLANLVSLTPGTLIFDISEDGKTLFVHGLDCSDPNAIRSQIRDGFERRIIGAFR